MISILRPKVINILRYFFALFSVLMGFNSFSQIPKNLINGITAETYNAKDFKIKAKPIHQYLGVYHFGESEGESELIVFRNADSLIIQRWSGSWESNPYTKREVWRKHCETFNQVTIRGNKVYFGEYSGLFAECKYENHVINTLLLFDDLVEHRAFGKDTAEVGFYNTSIDTFYDSKERYQLSVRIQPESFFKSKNKTDLKILRNTVYANYGLLFQQDGEMDKYFKKKEWYDPFLKDVSHCLTEIEKKNIEMLSRFEK